MQVLILAFGTLFAVVGGANADDGEKRAPVPENLAKIVPAKHRAAACFRLKEGNFAVPARLQGSEQKAKIRKIEAATLMLRVNRRPPKGGDDPNFLYIFYLETRFQKLKGRFIVEGYCNNQTSLRALKHPKVPHCVVECDGGGMQVSGDQNKVYVSWATGAGMRIRSCSATTSTIFVGPVKPERALRLDAAPLKECLHMEKYFADQRAKID